MAESRKRAPKIHVNPLDEVLTMPIPLTTKSKQQPDDVVYCAHSDSESPPYMKAGVTAPSTVKKSRYDPPDDEADVPLLNGVDGYNYNAPGITDYCKEPVSVTDHLAWKKLVAATSLCLIFMIIELVGGYVAGSLAVMTDAAHLLSDCVGFLVGLFAVWISGQPANNRFTYGYHRAEVLGALLSISVIWILTGIFVYLAVERLIKGDFEIHADAMLIVSAIGIVINMIMGSMLHSGGHSHSHPREGHPTPRGTGADNINVKAAVIHVLGDLVQSTGVFISALIIKFYPSTKVIDPWCTFFCCLIVMVSTVPVLRQSVWVLLESFPPDIDYRLLYMSLSRLEGVQDVHALHVWALTPSKYVVTVHLAVGGLADKDEVLQRAQALLHEKFRVERTTIQVERSLQDLLAQ
ncbi:zinc ion transmembrane transport [Nesidiocoris tenuis]|uniref:Zinc ion transmembrane transport n=1 Tax=Nesidiocoris tenuis TaxID=355587 RepID=A0ABN7AVC4_9HEMI|nr:zinc ion transmembrane transport [Nesidiocoris tenuis]